MKLFGSYTSPYVRHCRIALLQEEHDFEIIETDYETSAQQSPTAKVPYFSDGDLFLTDSSSITKYAREKKNKKFLPCVSDFDAYALVNTALDSAINIFLLERDGVSIENSDYMKRQATRLEVCLSELDDLVSNEPDMQNDFNIRAACFLDWGHYRKRFDFSKYKNLVNCLAVANADPYFKQTAPPSV